MTIRFPPAAPIVPGVLKLAPPLDEALAWNLVGLILAPPSESLALFERLASESSELACWTLAREADRSGRLRESIAELGAAIGPAGFARFLHASDPAAPTAYDAQSPRLNYEAPLRRFNEALPDRLRSIGTGDDPQLAFDRAVLVAPFWALTDGSSPASNPSITTDADRELPWDNLPLPGGWRRLWRRATMRYGIDESALARETLAAARDASESADRPSNDRPDEAPLAYRTLERAIGVVLQRVRDDDEFRRRLDAERWASMKELAYGAGHEINNPLANIASRAQSLSASERDPDRRTKLQVIERQAFRAFTMIQNLTLVADPPTPAPVRFDWSAALRGWLAKWIDEATAKGTTIEPPSDAVDEAWLVADVAQIELVFDELIRNAIEASPDGTRIRATGPRAVEEDLGASIGGDDLRGLRSWWLVEIADEGPGLSPVARERLFDPFFSGREAGRGQGFGLSKARRIVENHGGLLRCRELSPRGLAMQWFLPRTAAPAEGS